MCSPTSSPTTRSVPGADSRGRAVREAEARAGAELPLGVATDRMMRGQGARYPSSEVIGLHGFTTTLDAIGATSPRNTRACVSVTASSARVVGWLGRR